MKKIEINIFSYLFIAFCFIILVNDYLTFFFNWNYFISLLISGVLSLGIIHFVNKKIQITKEFDKADWIFYILLFLVFAITIVFPDRMYDTLNYHLYSQVHPFNNLLTGDFFPSRNINSYTYSFTDRAFYPFRLVFGYRLGLIFNYLCLIVIYHQIKQILMSLNIKNALTKTLIATFSIFTFSIIDLIDVYYVDYFSIIFLLEIFIHIFKKYNYDINQLFPFMAFLSGLAFCAKISNAYFILGLFLLFLINYWQELKKFKLKTLLVSSITFCFPFMIYMIYTYLETGNPFFPFYNTIFQSNLYSNTNWMDLRFGPKGLLETLIWPVKMLFEKNRAIDISIIEPTWAIGYLIAISYLGYYLLQKIRKRKVNKTKLLFMVCLIFYYLIWAKFVLGYTRYGLFLLILSTIAIGIFIIDCIKYKKYICLPVIIVLLSYHVYYNVFNYVYQADYWSANNIFGNGLESYKYNVKQLFVKDEPVQMPENSAWGVVNANSGYMMLLNDEIPIYSLVMSTDTEYAKNLLNERLEKITHLYTLADAIEFQAFIDNLNSSGYKIKEFYKTSTPSFLNYNNYLYIVEIDENTSNIMNNYEEFVQKKLSFPKKENTQISYWIGLNNKSKNESVSNYQVQLVSKKHGEEEIISTSVLPNDGQMIRVSSSIDTRNTDELEIRVVDEKNNLVEDKILSCVNLEIK